MLYYASAQRPSYALDAASMVMPRERSRRALHGRVSQPLAIATPGGLVSDTGTFTAARTVFRRVAGSVARGAYAPRDRAGGQPPMAGNAEAVDDLRRILAGRSRFRLRAISPSNPH